MKKIAKALAAIALAGTMGVGICGTAACSKEVEVPGKSAYEIAVENGFKGTEAEWLESLKVPVTEQTTVLSYTVEYGEDENGNRTATFVFTMSDGSKITKTEVLPAHEVGVHLQDRSVIWTKDEVKNKTYSTAGLGWSVQYSNGGWGYVPLTAAQIGKIYYWEEEQVEFDEQGTFPREYNVEAQYNKAWSEKETFRVYVVENLNGLTAGESEITYGNSWGSNGISFACKKGENALSKLSIATRYNIENDNGYNEYYRMTPITEQMLDKKIDTSKTGEEKYTVTYGEELFEIEVTVYDPAVTSIQYASIYDSEEERVNSITVTAGKTTIAAEAAKLVGKELNVYYYEQVNGKYGDTIKITADMLDYSKVNDTKPGYYFMNVIYGGYECELPVVVNPDMDAATKTHTLTGQGFSVLTFMNFVITKVELYNNGYAEAYAINLGSSGSGEMPLSAMLGYMAYTLKDNALEISYNGEKIAIYSVDTENNTFGAYAFGEATATYTGEMEEMGTYTLKTYANGYAELILGEGEEEVTLVLGYVKEGNVLKIAPVELMGLKFTIGENDTVTVNMEDIF